METTKKEFKYFNIMQWKQEEQYLRMMHNKGWKFENVKGLGMYHFTACEPEDVVYQLDYNKECESPEYLQMFADCGWEHILDFVGYSYFRKPAAEMNGDEEIFCDDESRFEMIKRVFKGRIVPLILLFVVLIMNLISQTHSHGTFTNAGSICTSAALILYVIAFSHFTYQYFTYFKNIRK